MRPAAALCVFLAFSAAVVGRASDVYLDIHRPGFQKIPVAILQFQAGPENREVTRQIGEVLHHDLDYSQLFDLRTDAPMQSPPSVPDRTAVTQAAKVGIQGVVWAQLQRRGEELVLEAYVYETARGEQVIATRIVGSPSTWRAISHRLADKIIAAFTGEKGVAESRIAYVSDATGSKEIYLMDYDGAGVTRVSADRSIIVSPRWFPNGKTLVFTSFRSGNPDIYLLNIETGERSRLIAYPGLNISASFSPQGDRMAFASSREENEEIYSADPSGKNAKRLTFNAADDLSPSWSPTGGQIAFTSDRGGTPQIYVMDSDGSNVRRLTFEGDYNTSPSWSPKGDWIAYSCRNGERRLRICLMTPDGQTGRQLSPSGEGDDESPSFAPNGRDIVFSSNREGKTHIYTLHLDGTGLRRLTSDGANNISPAWSPG